MKIGMRKKRFQHKTEINIALTLRKAFRFTFRTFLLKSLVKYYIHDLFKIIISYFNSFMN